MTVLIHDLPFMAWKVIPNEEGKFPTIAEISNHTIGGITEVVVGTEIDFSQPFQLLEFLRFLRDATGFGLRVIWGGCCSSQFPLDYLYHLYPPELGLRGYEVQQVERWRTVYHFGMFFYRVGPGFITMKDIRPFRDSLRFTTGEATIISAVTKILQPTSLYNGILTDIEVAASLHLVRHQLVLQLESAVLFLPYRIKRWPIPSTKC